MTISALDRIGLKLARDKAKEAPAPATAGLGEAIEQIIRQQVDERVADAMEKQKPVHHPRVPPHLRDFTDKAPSSEFPPPPPTTKPPRDMTMLIQRDETGRIETFTVGDHAKFQLQRDARGRTVRVVQLD